MKCVLDASAAVEIVLRKPDAKKFVDVVDFCQEVMTSDLFKAETANVFAKHVRGGIIDEDAALTATHDAYDLIDTFADIEENYDEALFEAMHLKHSVYDMLYLTLARRHSAVLLTVDQKLKKHAIACGIKVV